MARISSLCERPRSDRPRRLADWLNPTGEQKVHSLIPSISLPPGSLVKAVCGKTARTVLSGGRRRALRWAPPPTRHRRSGGIEATRPRGGKGAPAGGTGGGKDGQRIAPRLGPVSTSRQRIADVRIWPEQRPGLPGMAVAIAWLPGPRGYATARSEASVCRGAGCGRTRTSGSVGGQGQQRPWSTRRAPGMARSALSGAVNRKANADREVT